jgi:PAS domain S-box-containing protein
LANENSPALPVSIIALLATGIIAYLLLPINLLHITILTAVNIIILVFACIGSKRKTKANILDTTHIPAYGLDSFKSFAQHLPEIVWVIGDDTSIRYVSPSVKAILGYDPSELNGIKGIELIHRDDRAVVGCGLQTIIDRNDDNHPTEFRCQHSNGSWICLEATGSRLYEPAGTKNLLIIARDISYRKSQEKRIQLASEIINKSPAVAFIWINDEGWPVEYVTENVMELTGYTPDDFLTCKVCYGDIICGKDKQRVIDEVNRYSNNQSITRFCHEPYRIITKSGIIKWVDDTTEIRRNESGRVTHYQGIVLDITEIKNTELALRESEEKYRVVVERATDGITIVQDSILKFVNQTLADMLGYTVQEMINVDFREFIHPDGLPIAEQSYEKRMKGENTPTSYESALIGKNGQKTAVELNGGIIRYQDKSADLVFIRNISKRKKAEEELRISEKRFQELFNSVNEGIVIIDTNDKIEYNNPAFAAILEEEDISKTIDKSITEYIPADQIEKYRAERAKRKRGISSHYEIEMMTAKHNKKIFLNSASPRFDKHNNFIGTLAALTDLTETRRLQEFISRAQRLETAGRIAGQVAHDFNNLLAPLMAYPEFIKSELPKNSQAIKYLADIETAAVQMADINQQLLTLGRRGHYNMAPLDLNDIIKQVIGHLMPTSESLTIKTNLATNLMPIKGGSSQLFSAIQNLIINARDSMLDIGIITVATGNCYLDSLTGKFGRVPRGEYVKLTITDSGSGIPENIISKILEPFFTTKAPGRKKGSGLGLSIVHAVIEDHNGYIDLESTVGEGTSFYLYLPITRENIPSIDRDHITGGIENILVVDDDAVQRSVCLKLLEKLGYRAIAAESGEQAIEIIENNPQDLVILDMIMPGGMDGFETYKRILNLYPNQKAIIISGYAESEKVHMMAELGAGEFIKKPLTFKTLAIAVRRELDRRIVSSTAL